MMLKQRNFHQLAIIRRETFGTTRVVASRKRYTRKIKHKKRADICDIF
jgi:hypothetical protein